MEPSTSAPIAAIEALALEPAIDRIASELWAVVFAHLATTPAFGQPLSRLEVALGASLQDGEHRPFLSDLCSASLTCKAWNGACKEHSRSIWNAVLASPRVQPYVNPTTPSTAPPTEVFLGAMALRDAWRRGALGRPERRGHMLAFHSYVRCLEVTEDGVMIAVGLYNGEVVLCSSNGEWKGRAGAGGHADGEVTAIDIVGSVVVSGSGQPVYYYDQTCPGATLRIVRLDGDVPPHVTHEIGKDGGGHRNSIRGVKIVDYAGNLGEAPTTCTAVTSSDDGEVIVWDLLKGKVVRKMGVALHDDKTPWASNIVVVDKATILTAAGGEGFPQVIQYNWQTGAKLRVVAKWEPLRKRPTALSFHAPTSTLAVGFLDGDVAVYRFNPECGGRELACYPLTNIHVPEKSGIGNYDGASYRTAVASVQHHGDVLVYAARSGRLRVMTTPEFRDEGCPYGILTDGGAVQMSTRQPLQRTFVGPELVCVSEWNVRMYVSTVRFEGVVLTSDGFDNQVGIVHVGRSPTGETE